MAQLVRNPPADAEDTGDMSSVPGSGRSPGEEMQSTLVEEPRGLQSRRFAKISHDQVLAHTKKERSTDTMCNMDES